MANPVEPTLDRLAADAAAGRITEPVSRTYPLADVPAAFADFAAGTVGKIAVTVTAA
jgi:NADPH:quinone reductase-like Zn-dependent oxidoreductase